MQIWVDADACPGEIKELLYRAAERLKVKLTLVANQSLRIPRSEFIETLLVPDGANIADRRIVELTVPGDLVVTADVPLAADVVAKGAEAIDPRGGLYTHANIGERLAVRNMLDQLRGSVQSEIGLGHADRERTGASAHWRHPFHADRPLPCRRYANRRRSFWRSRR